MAIIKVSYKTIRSRNSDFRLREAGVGAGAERNNFGSTTVVPVKIDVKVV
jgi:hypothetical protein